MDIMKESVFRFVEVDTKGVIVQVTTTAGFYTVGGTQPFYYNSVEAASADLPRHAHCWIQQAHEWAKQFTVVGRADSNGIPVEYNKYKEFKV